MTTHNDRTFHHHHAAKLDDPERKAWLPAAEVVQSLGLKPGQRVADVGAGTGYFALPFAAAVGATGWVAALDLQPEMLALLSAKPVEAGSAPITLVQGTALRTGLPGASFDHVFLGNVWHELDDLDAVVDEARRVLVRGGQLAILDWRADVAPPPGPAHRVPAGAVVERLERLGFTAQTSHLGAYSYLVRATSGR